MPENDSELRRNQIKFLFQKGIETAFPKNLFKRFITLQNNLLTINSINNSHRVFNLDSYKNIYVTGAGKASCSMAEALEEMFAGRINSGIVVTKYGFTKPLRKIKILEASHPVPDNNSTKAADEILNLINSAGENDLVINLISGGASSLLTLPVNGISLNDKIITTQALLKCEADIDEINTIRKCLSKVKGGGLIAGAKAEVISLIISDVIGDDLGTIASGPTVAAIKNYSRSMEIIKKYKIESLIPDNVFKFLDAGRDSITTFHSAGDRNYNFLIGNNDIVVDEIFNLAEQLGYNTLKINKKISGEVNETAKYYFNYLMSLKNIKKPLCVVSGGETTVAIKGNGLGGRNQQFCLAVAEFLKDKKDIIILSGGTDGNDGPTDAAGAIIDSDIFAFADSLNLDYKYILINNDSYNYFEKTKALIKTGPTLTNVMDIQIAILY